MVSSDCCRCCNWRMLKCEEKRKSGFKLSPCPWVPSVEETRTVGHPPSLPFLLEFLNFDIDIHNDWSASLKVLLHIRSIKTFSVSAPKIGTAWLMSGLIAKILKIDLEWRSWQHTFQFRYEMWGIICAWRSYDPCTNWACPVYCSSWPGLVGELGYWLTTGLQGQILQQYLF